LSRIVVVSNRVALPRGAKPPQGGLATAVLAALEQRGGLWYGWSGTTAPDTASKVERQKLGKIEFATVPLSKRHYDEYYKGYSNRVLWPLLHSRLDRLEYWRTFEIGYRRVNDLLAEKLVPMLKRDDLIWVHDYHLFPFGHALRLLGCRQAMGFFLHVPFPSFDILRSLPGFRRLLRVLGAYDQVGFQTELDLWNFKNSVRYALPGAKIDAKSVTIEGHRTFCGAFPISIDIEDVVAGARRGAASVQGKRLIASLRQRKLIIGVDRLDYTKGLVHRLKAFRRLLERYPPVRGKVTFLQIAQPSRGDVPDYQQMRDYLNSLTGEINGRYAEYDWTPIRYLNKGFAHTTILGFLAISDVGLITPLRDGMNLVAKEFVAAQTQEEPGVLVLSGLAGAARELDGGAMVVNPHDIDDVAEALAKAILMPSEERVERWNRMMEVLRRNDIHHWRGSFIRALDSSGQG
jgi:trehalose 6-phosphate synthase